MAEIYVLPGVERRDLLGVLPSEHILQKAIENGVVDAVVVGRDRKGELYVASACADVDRVVGFLMRAVQTLTGATIENDQVIEPKEPA